MKFLNSSDKIKFLRKQLKMNQEDLVDINLTRGYISMIEIGKRGLNRDIAEIISKKFTEKAKSLGLNINTDAEYILRDSSEEAAFYCNNELQSTNSISKIEEIINVAEDYKLEKVNVYAYIRLGEIYFSKRDFTEAYINYLNALNYCKNTTMMNMEPFLYNKLGHCKMDQLEFLEALALFNLANYHAIKQNDDDIIKISTYNMALCNKKLNKIDAALEYINMYLCTCHKEKDMKAYIYANIMKANCYEAKHSITISINILLNLLKEFEDTDNPILGYVYNNLGDFYLTMNNLEESKYYFEKAEQIRKEKDIYNLSHTLIQKSRIFIKSGLYNEAISLIKEGLDLASKFKDTECLLKGYEMLSEIYSNLKNVKELENTYKIIISLSEKNKNKDDRDLIGFYAKLANLYLEENEYENLKKLFNLNNNIS